MQIIVLLMVLTGPSKAAIGSVEFHDKAACEAAGAAFKTSYRGIADNAWYACVPKSSMQRQ